MVKATNERKEAAWKGVMEAMGEVGKERCVEKKRETLKSVYIRAKRR